MQYRQISDGGSSSRRIYQERIISQVDKMAKKQKTVYMCTECGNEYLSWQGQCSYCGSWNTIVEHKISDLKEPSADSRRRTGTEGRPVKLGSVGTSDYARMSSGIGELDRVLGSGEESEEQVKLRADRVCSGSVSDNLYIYPETSIENILAVCEEMKPCFLIIDSIQTMYSAEVDSVAGSVTQIRACSNLLIKFAKTNNVPVFIVAHVTKSGELAGPKTIEHMVDCVLSFAGERDRDLRILRSFKNRFGTTDEIGAFRMTSEGMMEVSDLSGSLIETDSCEEGSVISAVYEGSRPVFFEIQALVTQANVGFARRTAVGINYNRLSMILAVLEKKAGLNLLNYDVYVNVVGGMNTGSTATDLAVALAIYSSFKGKTSSRRIVAVGEVGLTGHLRSIPNTEKIVQEAVRLGYEAVILPDRNARQSAESGKVNVSDSGKTVTITPPGADGTKGIRIIGASNISDAIRAFIS